MDFERLEIKKEKIKKKIELPVEEQLEGFFTEVFKNGNSKQRFEELLRRLQAFLIPTDNNRLDQNTIDEIKKGLENISACDDKEDFFKQGLIVLSPLIDWYKDDKRTFEAKLRENVVAVRGFTPLNEMLTYGRGKDHVHIHVSPSETMSISEKLFLVKDGFHKLADLLKKDDSVKQIVAKSWIVAANPGLLQNFGFHVVKQSEENGERVDTAVADRDSFFEAMNKYPE